MANVRSHKGSTPQFGERTWVDSSAVVIGNVTTGEDCSIWPMTVVRGDMHKIRIGARCSVQDGSVLHITHASDFNPGGWPLIIGDDVTIGHKALLAVAVLWAAGFWWAWAVSSWTVRWWKTK